MIERHKQGKLTWVDVQNPSPNEIHDLIMEYGLQPNLTADANVSGLQQESVLSDKAIKVTLHFPIVKRTDISHPHEIKFIIQKNVLVSFRYEDIEAIHRFKKEFEVISLLYKTKKDATGAHLFLALLRELNTALGSKLDYLEGKMNDIEKNIFEGHEKETVFTLSDMGRRLTSFRQAIRPHDEVFRVLKGHLDSVFGTKVAEGLSDIHGQHFFLLRRANGLFETLTELRNTNIDLLNTKQNEIMKTLTIVSFITFPLMLFTSMFGMNTHSAPIIGRPGDFWLIVIIMTVVSIALFTFFKFKKWM